MNNEELDRIDRLYGPTDKKYQGACVAYMYGIDYDKAMHQLDNMAEVDITNSCEYAAVRDYPDRPAGARRKRYEQRLEERARVAEQYNLSPMDAFIKRDELLDKAISESYKEKRDIYYFVFDGERAAACREYTKLTQNILSSSSMERMEALDRMAAESGLKFTMTNETAYNQPHAMITPRFEMTQIEKNLNDEFTDAVASIPVPENPLEQ